MSWDNIFKRNPRLIKSVCNRWIEVANSCREAVDGLFTEAADFQHLEMMTGLICTNLKQVDALTSCEEKWEALAYLTETLFYTMERLRICPVGKWKMLLEKMSRLLDEGLTRWMTDTAFFHLQTSPDSLKAHWMAVCELVKNNGWEDLQTLCEYALSRFLAASDEEYEEWTKNLEEWGVGFHITTNDFFQERERGNEMISNTDTFYKESVENKDVFQLKRLLVNLLTRRIHLLKSIRTGMGRFRHPSYHLELLTLEQRIMLVQAEIYKKQEETEDMPKLPIERFLEGQASNYYQALSELRKGKKVGHWMWYVFPQLRFLGYSDRARYYGIADLEEAKAYCANETLHERYLACCNALNEIEETDPVKVMGEIDARKLQSSLTLFHRADEENAYLYEDLIKKFFDGEFDRNTLRYLERGSYVKMQLQEVHFQKIKHGYKTIEVRLNDTKRRAINVGSKICFINEDNGETIWAEVLDLHHFATFKALFESDYFPQCGFQGRTPCEAVECMRQYYSEKEEKSCGVVGIEIMVMKEDE